MAEERTRTYSWDDPFALRDAMAGRSGLELMQAMATGEISPPPIAQTLGFRLVEAQRGHALFECEPAEYHYNPIGVVHAGLAMTLMDSAMGLAFVTTLDEPVAWTTLEVKCNFTRALTVDSGVVRCTGAVVHPGRRVTTTEARVEDSQGRLCAHGTSTILVLGG
jgi:uncharacterized protein (TIGR00369 family)